MKRSEGKNCLLASRDNGSCHHFRPDREDLTYKATFEVVRCGVEMENAVRLVMHLRSILEEVL